MNTRFERRRRARGALLILAAAHGLFGAGAHRSAHAAPSEDGTDPMAPYRERFRAAMERYKEGAYADAIVVWEAIYRELGPEKAYRLAFNLGRAYDAYGDATSAAERYEAYLIEVERRETRGEALEENVTRQAVDARARLAELARSRGRIHVLAAVDRPTVARIDEGEARPAPFSSLVAPGAHVVVFDPRTPSETRHDLSVLAGEAVDVRPPVRPVAEAVPSKRTPVATAPTSPIRRPYPLWVPLGVGGAALLSMAIPILTYRHALDLQERHDDPATPTADRDQLSADYDGARQTAYLSLAVPIALAAGAAALFAGYYFTGSKSDSRPASALRFDAGPTTLGVRF